MKIADTKVNDTEFYSKYINFFVVAERKNNKKAVGVLKGVTPDGKLFIKGKYMDWVIHPDEISDFSARPDRNKVGGEEDQ